MNRYSIKWLLARMTDYIEVRGGLTAFEEYMSEGAQEQWYEVEHIWADHWDSDSHNDGDYRRAMRIPQPTRGPAAAQNDSTPAIATGHYGKKRYPVPQTESPRAVPQS